jgi:hypothetical protein
MKIIRQGYTEHRVNYEHTWTSKSRKGWGRFLPCDQDGKVLDVEREARRQEFDQDPDLRYTGIRVVNSRYRVPSVGRCTCGYEVELGCFTNTCDRCGRDYNSAGQLLAPRSQWGEETGETAADILMADNDFCQ